MRIPSAFKNRHYSTLAIFQYFEYEHLVEPLKTVALYSFHLAAAMITELPDGPELTAGLRKLLEAKDCFVRQALDLPKPTKDSPKWPDENSMPDKEVSNG